MTTIAVLNLSGNVGKTTVARHLLSPRLPQPCRIISVETINADGDEQGQALRGADFAELQEFLLTHDGHAVVDIGASNIEVLLERIRTFQGSHEDFDFFVVPAVPPTKQQRDTIQTLLTLVELGVDKAKLRVVFNSADPLEPVETTFAAILDFAQSSGLSGVHGSCFIPANELFDRIKGASISLSDLAGDQTDFKALIKSAANAEDRQSHASRLANKRLAQGLVPVLDACFASLRIA